MSELTNIFTKIISKVKNSYNKKSIKERKALTLGLKPKNTKKFKHNSCK